MGNNSEIPPSFLQMMPWNSEEGAILTASSMHLRRNLARHNFPSKLQGPEMEQVLQALKDAFSTCPDLPNSKFYSQKDLKVSDRELIFEHFHFLHGFTDPPNGAGMVIDEKGLFLGLINGTNHLEMHSLNLNGQLETTWNHLSHIESHIGKAVDFAFTPKFGYLTSELWDCGTGLTVNAYLHLPALILSNQIESALKNAQDEEVSFFTLTGNLQELIGDLIIVQNNFTLGVTEESILHALQMAVTKLSGAEKTMRNHLKQEENIKIKDQISKGFGLLVHSIQLETKEALDLLSLMKLGVALGYVTNVSDQKLSELFFKSRRGHLVHLFPELKDIKEIGHKRAQFLKQELQGISLK